MALVEIHCYMYESKTIPIVIDLLAGLALMSFSIESLLLTMTCDTDSQKTNSLALILRALLSVNHSSLVSKHSMKEVYTIFQKWFSARSQNWLEFVQTVR